MTLNRDKYGVNAPDRNLPHQATHPTPGADCSAADQHTCIRCGLRELCVPAGLGDAEQEALSALVEDRRRLQRGDTLYHTGESFQSLYAIRSGSFKSVTIGGESQEQIGGFHLPGEILGLDGLANDHFQTDAIAMEVSEVCVIPYQKLNDAAEQFPHLNRQINRLLSREIVRKNGVTILLSGLRAEQRVAAFLLSIAERYHRLGYSGTQFVLRMTREEIGSFLGLKLETVSRHLSAFDQQGVISIKQRNVQLNDKPMLQRLAGACQAGHEGRSSREGWLDLVQCQSYPPN